MFELFLNSLYNNNQDYKQRMRAVERQQQAINAYSNNPNRSMTLRQPLNTSQNTTVVTVSKSNQRGGGRLPPASKAPGNARQSQSLTRGGRRLQTIRPQQVSFLQNAGNSTRSVGPKDFAKNKSRKALVQNTYGQVTLRPTGPDGVVMQFQSAYEKSSKIQNQTKDVRARSNFRSQRLPKSSKAGYTENIPKKDPTPLPDPNQSSFPKLSHQGSIQLKPNKIDNSTLQFQAQTSMRQSSKAGPAEQPQAFLKIEEGKQSTGRVHPLVKQQVSEQHASEASLQQEVSSNLRKAKEKNGLLDLSSVSQISQQSPEKREPQTLALTISDQQPSGGNQEQKLSMYETALNQAIRHDQVMLKNIQKDWQEVNKRLMQRANLLQTLQMTNESVRGPEPFANTTLDAANPGAFDPFAMTGDITGFGDKSQSAIEHLSIPTQSYYQLPNQSMDPKPEQVSIIKSDNVYIDSNQNRTHSAERHEQHTFLANTYGSDKDADSQANFRSVRDPKRYVHPPHRYVDNQLSPLRCCNNVAKQSAGNSHLRGAPPPAAKPTASQRQSLRRKANEGTNSSSVPPDRRSKFQNDINQVAQLYRQGVPKKVKITDSKGQSIERQELNTIQIGTNPSQSKQTSRERPINLQKSSYVEIEEMYTRKKTVDPQSKRQHMQQTLNVPATYKHVSSKRGNPMKQSLHQGTLRAKQVVGYAPQTTQQGFSMRKRIRKSTLRQNLRSLNNNMKSSNGPQASVSSSNIQQNQSVMRERKMGQTVRVGPGPAGQVVINNLNHVQLKKNIKQATYQNQFNPQSLDFHSITQSQNVPDHKVNIVSLTAISGNSGAQKDQMMLGSTDLQNPLRMQLLEPEQQYDNYDSIDQQARTNQSVATMRVETYNNSMSRRKGMGSNEGTSSPIINKLQKVYAIKNVPKPKRTTVQSFSSNLGPSKAEISNNISKVKLISLSDMQANAEVHANNFFNPASHFQLDQLPQSERTEPIGEPAPGDDKPAWLVFLYQNDRQSLGFRSQPKQANRPIGQQQNEHNADLNNQSEDMINTSGLIGTNDQIISQYTTPISPNKYNYTAHPSNESAIISNQFSFKNLSAQGVPNHYIQRLRVPAQMQEIERHCHDQAALNGKQQLAGDRYGAQTNGPKEIGSQVHKAHKTVVQQSQVQLGESASKPSNSNFQHIINSLYNTNSLNKDDSNHKLFIQNLKNYEKDELLQSYLFYTKQKGRGETGVSSNLLEQEQRHIQEFLSAQQSQHGFTDLGSYQFIEQPLPSTSEANQENPLNLAKVETSQMKTAFGNPLLNDSINRSQLSGGLPHQQKVDAQLNANSRYDYRLQQDRQQSRIQHDHSGSQPYAEQDSMSQPNHTKFIPFSADDEEEAPEPVEKELAGPNQQKPLHLKAENHEFLIRKSIRHVKRPENKEANQLTEPAKQARTYSNEPQPKGAAVMSKDNLNNSKTTVSTFNTLNQTNANRKSTFLFGSKQDNSIKNNCRYSQQTLFAESVHKLQMKSVALAKINQIGPQQARPGKAIEDRLPGESDAQMQTIGNQYDKIEELQIESERKYGDAYSEHSNENQLCRSPDQGDNEHRLTDKITEQYAEEVDNTHTSRSQSRAILPSEEQISDEVELNDPKQPASESHRNPIRQSVEEIKINESQASFYKDHGPVKKFENNFLESSRASRADRSSDEGKLSEKEEPLEDSSGLVRKVGEETIPLGRKPIVPLRFGSGQYEGISLSKKSTPVHSDDEVTPRRGLEESMPARKLRALEESGSMVISGTLDGPLGPGDIELSDALPRRSVEASIVIKPTIRGYGDQRVSAGLSSSRLLVSNREKDEPNLLDESF